MILEFWGMLLSMRTIVLMGLKLPTKGEVKEYAEKTTKSMIFTGVFSEKSNSETLIDLFFMACVRK